MFQQERCNVFDFNSLSNACSSFAHFWNCANLFTQPIMFQAEHLNGMDELSSDHNFP
jgi:hypothetical protein